MEKEASVQALKEMDSQEAELEGRGWGREKRGSEGELPWRAEAGRQDHTVMCETAPGDR